MNRWVAAELADPAPLAAGAGAFTAVAHITAAGLGTQQGSGFLIHPALLVTAAHVVTYQFESRMLLAGRIDVDFGEARAGIWRAAVPLEYIASAGAEGRWDLAVLRLPQPLGETGLLSVTKPSPGGGALEATLWGNVTGSREAMSVRAVVDLDKVRFPLAASLPGWSGGPLTRPTTAPEGGVALALHRFWSQTAQQGEAVPLDPELLSEAIEAIRNIQSFGGA